MSIGERDRDILIKIVQYCDEIAQTPVLLGNFIEIFNWKYDISKCCNVHRIVRLFD